MTYVNIDLHPEAGAAGTSVYKAVAGQIARLIEDGELRPGQMLPSSRELSAQLQVSRDTIVNAYRELNRLAYTYGIPPKGTCVMPRAVKKENIEACRHEKTTDRKLSTFGRRIAAEEFCHPSSASYPGLNYGAVPQSALPVRRWRTLMQAACAPDSFPQLEYEPDVLGRSELRKAIAGYLFRTKGIECDWRQVVVFSISCGLINSLCKLLLEPGDTIAVEEPGYGAVKNIAKTLGLSLLPVTVDSHGFAVQSLQGQAGPVKLVYVTPGHQDPTGVILSLERRLELLAWAKEHGAWIVEDDYDGHFYYNRESPKTLWSLDSEASVIYSSTFWQILYPLTTIGYAVVPRDLLPAVAAAKKLQTEDSADAMVQMTLSKLLEDGYMEQHIKRTQRVLSSRRIAMIYELKRLMGNDIEIAKDSAGCHFVVKLDRWHEPEIREAAMRSRMPIVPTASYYLGEPLCGEYLVNFSLYPEAQASKIVIDFVEALATPALVKMDS
jgi:GntR family transcriptional regulator/MocR family aminotransferase